MPTGLRSVVYTSQSDNSPGTLPVRTMTGTCFVRAVVPHHGHLPAGAVQAGQREVEKYGVR